MGRPLAALIQQKTSTTSPPDDQSLDLFDPSGRQRSLSELTRAGATRHSNEPGWHRRSLGPRGMSRMGDKIMAMFPEGNLPGHPSGIVPDDVVYAVQENPDWDAEDIKRYMDWTNRPSPGEEAESQDRYGMPADDPRLPRGNQ